MILKYSEWASGAGSRWYTGDCSNLAGGSNRWWHAARCMNLTPAAFIQTIVEKYHATIISFVEEKDLLIYSFSSCTDAHRFVLDVNKAARAKKYQI